MNASVQILAAVTDLGKLVNYILKELTIIKTDVGILKADVGVLKNDVSTLKTDVSTLKDDVVTLKSDVSSIKATMVTKDEFKVLESQVAENSEQIKGLKTQVVQNSEEIQGLGKELAQNKEETRLLGRQVNKNELIQNKILDELLDLKRYAYNKLATKKELKEVEHNMIGHVDGFAVNQKKFDLELTSLLSMQSRTNTRIDQLEQKLAH